MNINKIYTDNFGTIKSFILQNNGSICDAQDVFQDALSIAWYNYRVGKFDPSKGSFDAYLIVIAKNKWIDQLRKKKKILIQSVEYIEDKTDDNIEDLENTEQKIEKLLFTFQQIGDKCKEILHAYYYQKERLDTIAVRFGTNADVIKTQKNRCMKKLKELMHANR